MGAISRPDEVARHLRLAGADREAVPHLARAAADARAVAALDQTVGYFEEALAIAPERAELWLALGELEAWRGRRDPSTQAFTRGLELLEGSDPLTLVRAWLRRARAYHGPICVPAEVLRCARTALEILDEAGVPAPAERSEAYGPAIAAGATVARAGRPDLAYGCWANAAGAAMAAGQPDRALEFIDRGMAALAGQGLQSLEVHLLAARSLVLRGAVRLDEARVAAEAEQALTDQLAQPELEAMAKHDRGLVELAQGAYEAAAELLGESLLGEAPMSRPLTRLALAEALARAANRSRLRSRCGRPFWSRSGRATSPTRSCPGWPASRV